MSAMNPDRKKRNLLSCNATQAVLLMLALSYANHANAERYSVHGLSIENTVTSDEISVENATGASFSGEINELRLSPDGGKTWYGTALADASQAHLGTTVDLTLLHNDTSQPLHNQAAVAVASWFYDDIIFTGPPDRDNNFVLTRQGMELDGTQEVNLFFGKQQRGHAWSIVRLEYFLYKVEKGYEQYISETGQRFLRIEDSMDLPQVAPSSGLLSQFAASEQPEMVYTEWASVPIGVPLWLSINLDTYVETEASYGSVIIARADFENGLRLPTTGPVFDLPEGYTVNSEQAGIVNNRFVSAVPVPTAFVGRLETFPGSGMYQAYYDSQLDITWAADANINGLDTWDNQEAWVADLTIGGVSGWRLPSANVNGDGTVVDCSGGGIAGCEDNEMGFLYWVKGITAATPSPFNNVQFQYWSATELASDPSFAWFLNFGNGSQNVAGKRGNTISAWAVHDGDVGDILDTDEDGDGLVDIADNCILIPNGPLDPDAGGNSQLDADGDGYGNICDPDFDNNNSVDFADLALLKSRFFTDDPDADLDGNGRVDFADLAILKSMFFSSPGPSAVAPSSGGCVNTIRLNQSVSGNWESTCTSTRIEGSYAKYYTFTLPSSQEVTIDLQSSIDTYLLLLNGSGDNGDVIDLNDDAGNSTNSQIIQTLSAGSYTIEATTYDPGETGAFDLSVR